MARTVFARRALVAVLATFACSLAVVQQAAASPADEFPAGGRAMTDAWQTATGFWAQTPCGGSVALSWGTLDEGVNAESHWAATDQSRSETYTSCSIVFNERRSFDYPMLCTIMTHEMGHLLGQPHSENSPDDVMSPKYLQPIGSCDLGTQTFSGPAPSSVAHAARVRKARTKARARKRAATRTGRLPAKRRRRAA